MLRLLSILVAACPLVLLPQAHLSGTKCWKSRKLDPAT